MQIFFLLLAFFPLFLHATLSLDKEIQSEYVVLMNGKTGKVLWSKNPDAPCFPASTTKIATTFYALMQKPNAFKEKIKAQKEALITVSPFEKLQGNYSKCPSFWLESDGTHVGIRAGQTWTFEELLYGTLLSSGNDASNVIAHSVSGSIPTFVEELNKFIKKLGCLNTNFCNPHGLHHPEHVTTARDMAQLARYALLHPFFKKAVSMTKYERQATGNEPRLCFIQSNKMLQKGKHHYPHAIGVKTGYTSKAGHSVVVAAERGDRLVIASIFKAKDRDSRWHDARVLFDACFKEEKVEKIVLLDGEQPFKTRYEGSDKGVVTYTTAPVLISYYPSEEPTIRSLLVWDLVPLPVKAGTKVGEIRILADDKEHVVVPLYAKNEVVETFSAKISRYSQGVLDYISAHWVLLFAVIAIFGVAVVWIRKR
jgi:serine-type D-Ala-D-Ala carboxypeptidase (penicillin-binding protein 5/6)